MNGSAAFFTISKMLHPQLSLYKVNHGPLFKQTFYSQEMVPATAENAAAGLRK